MSSWYLTKKESSASDELAKLRIDRCKAHLELQGFRRFHEFENATHRALFAYSELSDNDLVFVSPGNNTNDWVIGSGTVVYQSLSGSKALEKIFDEYQYPFRIPPDMYGQFALLINKNNQLHLITDQSGCLQVFHDTNWQSISTSFLAVCEQQETLSLDDQAVYEYAFCDFPLGDDTIFRSVKRLSLDLQLLIGEEIDIHQTEPLAIAETSNNSVDELVEEHAGTLLSHFAQIGSVWGDNINCPLSGGLDSRLVLACLRNVGITPNIYVYGNPSSEDRQIAALISSTLGLTVETIDKSDWNTNGHNCTPTTVNNNFHEEDGLPVDATALFDTGASATTRKMRHSGNSLALSGGCGEVYRNFFYLPNKSLRVEEVAKVFFCRFDTAELTSRFSESEYIESIAHKMSTTISADPKEVLSRQQIEKLYPKFRCRSFFGREVSIENKHGDYLLPFIDNEIVNFALKLPMALKHAGIFESALLQHIDPELAAIQSSYGHDFSKRPSIAHQLSELSTMMRPLLLRKSSYAIKRRISKLRRHGATPWLKSASLVGVVETKYPYMSSYFEIEKIADLNLQQRVASMEYICAHYSDKLR